MPLTYDDLRSIVESRAWDRLLGEIESDNFDCKRGLYDLAVESQKMELAKDVSAFANASGGFIFLGIETRKSANHPGDEVAVYHPFARGLLDHTQYADVLDAWLVPKLDGCSVDWVAQGDGDNLGFGVIRVPRQPDSNRPVVIAKVVLESGRRKDMVVGYSERRLDRSQPAAASEVAGWLSDGRNYQSQIQSRLDEIIARLENSSLTSASSERPNAPGNAASESEPSLLKSLEVETTERVSSSLAVTGLIARPYFVLAAVPVKPTEVPTIFKSGPMTATSLLEKPPVLRYAGWSLETLGQAKIVEGRFRQVTAGDEKVLRLYRDGVLIHAVAADQGFLGWGESAEEFRRDPVIKSLALIEVTYLFCLFYDRLLPMLANVPEIISIHWFIGGMQSGGTLQPVRLAPRAVSPFKALWRRDTVPAPKDNDHGVIRTSAVAMNVGAVAYEVIREIYLWFGVEPADIPYSTELDGQRVLDPDKIRES